MDTPTLLNQLEQLARKLGIEVRYETFEAEAQHCLGGSCRVRGKHMIIVNQDRPLEDQAMVLGKCLRGLNLENVYMRPGLRDYLKKQAKGMETKQG